MSLVPLVVLAGTLVPSPQVIESQGAAVSLPQTIAVQTASTDDDVLAVGGWLETALAGAGFTVATGGATVTLHRFGDTELVPLPDGVEPFAAMGDEGYALHVASDANVIVAATTAHGLFNGAASVLGLVLNEGGAPESSVEPQLVLDYPDHPIRGGYLYSIHLEHDDGLWVVTDTVRDRVEELARLKINFLVQSQSTFALSESRWETARDGMTALGDLCAERHIELVPSVGSLRGSSIFQYRDGWWIRREPFTFVSATVEDVVFANSSFELDEECDDLPDAWTITTIPSGGTWTRDTSVAYDGAVSMNIDVVDITVPSDDPDSTNNLVLRQTVAAPAAGAWAATAWVRTESLTGRPIQLTTYGRDTNNDTVTDVVSDTLDGTQDWTRLIAGPIHLPAEATTVSVYSRIQEPGLGTAWIDDVRLVPMVQDTGNNWILDEPGPITVEEAVPDLGASELLTNSTLDADGDSNGVPDGWTINDPTDPQATWSRDTSETATCGSASMRLDVPDLPASGGDSSNNVQLRQTIAGPIPPGIYALSVWLKAEDIAGYPPQVTFLTRIAGSNQPYQSVTLDDGDHEWQRHVAILKVTETADDMVVYSRLMEPGSGTLWVDDVSITRIDGGLRNVLRHIYDIRVESPDLSTTYTEGVDYEIIDGSLENAFRPDLAPSRIRRIPSGAIPSGAQVLVSYDANLFWSSNDPNNQAYNICTSHTLDELYLPALERVVNDLAPSSINFNSDEIRGFNRSGACHDASDGSLVTPNAELLASFFNNLVDATHDLAPTIQPYVWDDMFSNVHNGGIDDYQVRYGGSPGRTDRTVSEDLLDDSLHMVVWWYSTDWLAQMTEATAFFGEHGFTTLGSVHYDPINIADWSATTAHFAHALGVVVTPWENEDGVAPSAELFWNAPWEQVALESFETDPGFRVTGGATWTDDGSCAAERQYPTGTHQGGVCDTGAGTVALLPVSVTSPATYRVLSHARAEPALDATLRATWQFESGTSSADTVAVSLGGDSNFVRTESDFTVPFDSDEPPATVIFTWELPAGSDVALDNLAVRVARPGCPHGSVTAVTPASLDLGEHAAGDTLSASFELCNRGCRTLRLGSIDGDGLTFAASTPAWIAPDECSTLTGTATMPSQNIDYAVSLATNDDSGQPVVITVSARVPGGTTDGGATADGGTMTGDADTDTRPGAVARGRGCACSSWTANAGAVLLALVVLLRRRALR